MFNVPEDSTAEFIDTFMQRLAQGVFLLAIGYGLEAYIKLGLEGTPPILDTLQLGVTILVVIIILPQFIKMMRIRARNKELDCEPESFVVDVYKKASEQTFAITFIALILSDFVVSKFFNTLPSEFIIKAILSFTLFVFSISFFYLNRTDDDPNDLDEEE